jgi:hypothetical protein
MGYMDRRGDTADIKHKTHPQTSRNIIKNVPTFVLILGGTKQV